MTIFQQRWDELCNSSLGKSLPREILTYILHLLYISINHDLSYPYIKPIIVKSESGLYERTLEGHTDAVSCVSVFMGSDGHPRIVSGCQDHTLRVWSAETGLCERTLQGHTNSVICISFFIGSDGDPRIVSGSSDKTLKVWSETG